MVVKKLNWRFNDLYFCSWYCRLFSCFLVVCLRYWPIAQRVCVAGQNTAGQFLVANWTPKWFLRVLHLFEFGKCQNVWLKMLIHRLHSVWGFGNALNLLQVRVACALAAATTPRYSQKYNILQQKLHIWLNCSRKLQLYHLIF